MSRNKNSGIKISEQILGYERREILMSRNVSIVVEITGFRLSYERREILMSRNEGLDPDAMSQIQL